MEVSTTSSGDSATQNTGSPAMGKTASTSATQPKTPSTLEEALARIDELQRHASNKEEQAARHGKTLTAAEKELAAYREKERMAQEATLNEAQKLEKRIAEADQRNKQYQQQLVSAQVKLAAQAKGIIDPDIAALAIAGSLEYGEDGMPTNTDKALDELIKNKPYLVAKAEQQPASPAQTATTPQIPAMNPGRSTIPAPGQLPPKQWPKLRDVLK